MASEKVHISSRKPRNSSDKPGEKYLKFESMGKRGVNLFCQILHQKFHRTPNCLNAYNVLFFLSTVTTHTCLHSACTHAGRRHARVCVTNTRRNPLELTCGALSRGDSCRGDPSLLEAAT